MDFAELSALQLATSGEKMSKNQYKATCEALGAKAKFGLNVQHLKITYMSPGTDVDEDYRMVFETTPEVTAAEPEATTVETPAAEEVAAAPPSEAPATAPAAAAAPAAAPKQPEPFNWRVDDDVVIVTVPRPPEIQKQHVKVSIKPNHLRVTLGSNRVIDGELFQSIDPDLSTWTFEREQISVELSMKKKMRWLMLLRS